MLCSADKKILGLGRQFLDLKKSGKLDKFLEKKAKKRSNKGPNFHSSHPKPLLMWPYLPYSQQTTDGCRTEGGKEVMTRQSEPLTKVHVNDAQLVHRHSALFLKSCCSPGDLKPIACTCMRMRRGAVLHMTYARPGAGPACLAPATAF